MFSHIYNCEKIVKIELILEVISYFSIKNFKFLWLDFKLLNFYYKKYDFISYLYFVVEKQNDLYVRHSWLIYFSGEVLGRQKIDLKVCACPVRDFKSDNKSNETHEKKPVKRESIGIKTIFPKKLTSLE